MPYPNYHAFRVNNPNKYEKIVSKDLGKGILLKLGITKDGRTEEQAYWFDKNKWSFTEAKKWLKKNNVKYIEAEPAKTEGEQNMRNIFELTVKAQKEKQKVLTLPKGKFYIEKYDRYITFDNNLFEQIIDNFNNPDLSKPFIDINHNYEESYGDIVEMEIGEDGLYTYWELNERGVELIKNKQYKYISPAIHDVKDNKGKLHRNVLVAITLTNIPALLGSLPELQEQLQLTFKKTNKEGGSIMDNVIKLELGLDANVNDSIVLGKIKELKMELEKMKNVTVELETVKKEKTELETKLKKAEKTATELNNELQNIKQEQLKKEAEETIKKAIELGQYHPKLFDLKVDQYLKDKETILKELEILPKQKDEGQKTGTGNKDTGIQLEAKDKEIMLEIGLNPKDKEDVEIFLNEFKKRD